MNIPEIEWVDAPPEAVGTGNSSAAIDAIVDELKANPGKWARVARNTGHWSAKPYKNRGCEAVSRLADPKDKSKRYDIYARFVPKGPTAAQATDIRARAEAVNNAARQAAASATPNVRAVPGALTPPPTPGAKRDLRTRPRRMEKESDQAYQFRLDRWERGVPVNGRPVDGL